MAVRRKAAAATSPAERQAKALERIADALEALGELGNTITAVAKVIETTAADPDAIARARDAAIASLQDYAADPFTPRTRAELEEHIRRQDETAAALAGGNGGEEEGDAPAT